MSTALTIPATETNPLYIAHYPMYNGKFAAHVFWHKTIPSINERPHKEEIWFSMYRDDANEWSKPKRISHKNATICLINYDTTHSPAKLSFASIFLPTTCHSLEYAGHQNYTPLNSLTKEQLHTEPTTLDIFKFYSNPNYFFNPRQHQLLSAAMLKRFPSTHPQFEQTAKLWSPNNPTRPTQCLNWPSHPVSHLSEQSVPTQIIQTSASRKFVVQNYPYSYGDYRTAQFWISTQEKTKTTIRKEAGFVQTFCPSTNTWTTSKAVSPAKATICLMHIQNNPSSPTFGLPFFTAINLNLYSIQKEEILAFAVNPSHYFNQIQQALLIESLLSFYNFVSPEMEQLRQAWSNRPTVPDTP